MFRVTQINNMYPFFFWHKYESGVIFSSLALHTTENGYMLLIWVALNNSVDLI